jgi:hypothetical protein
VPWFSSEKQQFMAYFKGNNEYQYDKNTSTYKRIEEYHQIIQKYHIAF